MLIKKLFKIMFVIMLMYIKILRHSSSICKHEVYTKFTTISCQFHLLLRYVFATLSLFCAGSYYIYLILVRFKASKMCDSNFVLEHRLAMLVNCGGQGRKDVTL